MKRVILIFVSMVLWLNASEIRVAVAANVGYAIQSLQSEFEHIYPDTKISVVLGSSGKLTAQINNGAPYDMFMSADMKFPQALFESGQALAQPVVYAYGALSLLSSNVLDFHQGLKMLLDDSISKIAVANPKTAPYGKASIKAMQKAGVYTQSKQKIVYAESISQAVTYALTAADMGFVAKSALFSPEMKKYKEGKNWIDVEPSFYTPIAQGVVMLQRSKEKKEVKAFYDFILSPKAKEIFQAFGYRVP